MNIFKKIKWAKQRIDRGYSDYDAYDLDLYLTSLLRDSLRTLAKNTHSYPEGMTYDEWISYLNLAADLLDRSVDRSFDTCQYYLNEYEDAYTNYLSQCRIEDGQFIFPKGEELEEVRKKYLARENAIAEARRSDRNKALDMIKERWDDLWD